MALRANKGNQRDVRVANTSRRGFEVRAWQREALALWSRSSRGIVAAVTGSGKTSFGLLCAQHFLHLHPDGQVLVAVPTVALADQWYLTILEETGVVKDAVSVASTRSVTWERGIYVVGVVNTLRALLPRRSLSRPTLLIADECHRLGSAANARVLGLSYTATLGLSATPERQYDDGFERMIKPALGDVLYRYEYDRALADGVIVPFQLANVRFPLTVSEQAQYDKLTQRIAILLRKSHGRPDERATALLRRRATVSWRSKLRVPLAIKLALRHRNERSIVFHESVAQANEIHQALLDRGVRATIYHTGLSAVTRTENLRLFRSGYYSCVICCRALDEGLNVPSTSVGIVASGTSSIRQRIQRLGRVLRQIPGKDHAVIYTLYGTRAEEDRLRDESLRLQGTSSVRWVRAEVHVDG